MQSFSCLWGDNGLGKRVKDEREEGRGGEGRGILYGQGERRERPCSSCVLEALGCPGLMQPYPSLRGLGRHFQVARRGRKRWERHWSCWRGQWEHIRRLEQDSWWLHTTQDEVWWIITFLSTPNLPHTMSNQNPTTTEKRAYLEFKKVHKNVQTVRDSHVL